MSHLTFKLGNVNRTIFVSGHKELTFMPKVWNFYFFFGEINEKMLNIKTVKHI